MGRRSGLWAALLACASVGCGRSGFEAASQETPGHHGDLPLPQGGGLPGQPGVTPTPVVESGRGLDGAWTFVEDAELDECVPLVSGDGSLLVLPGKFPLLSAGRRVLVMQVGDAFASSGETMVVQTPGRAGQWEIAEILDVTGDTLRLIAPLAAPFAYETNVPAARFAQVCLVRELTDATLADGVTVSPAPWNGFHGGVLAWQVSGTLAVGSGARLSADGRGFRGGMCGPLGNAEDVEGFDVSEGEGGGKGEGLDPRGFVLLGRGAVANAGGGGNGDNAGGGGGGNAGRGGNGGEQQADLLGSNAETQGIGGGTVADADRLVLGGGGGAGHLDGVALERCGGAGGGVLFVRAAALAGDGTLSADGEDGALADRDGASGGGAGGVVLLEAADASAFTGQVRAEGGDGGDVWNGSYSDFFGPGGGGGGGRVRLLGVAAAQARVTGGSHGENLMNGSGWGAAGGEDGAIETP